MNGEGSLLLNIFADSFMGQKMGQVTSFVSQLGVDLNLPPDFDEREAYRKHLEEKYQL